MRISFVANLRSFEATSSGPMNEPSRPSPWGTHRPGLLFRGLLAASRAVPQVAVVKQMAFLLRRAARAVEADPVDVEQWGLRLRLRTRGNISESTWLFMPRRWDLRERRWLAANLPADASDASDATFVDVGANAGGYVWWVLHRLGTRCRIVAVEPDPDLRARLHLNLETNGVENVQVIGVAVGPEGGDAWLRVDPRNRGQNTLADGPSEGAIRVPVRPLPELVRGAGLTRIDALKIDVEGLEDAILQDFFRRAPEALWPRLLLTELRPSAEHRALLDRLSELGYRMELRTGLNAGLRR